MLFYFRIGVVSHFKTIDDSNKVESHDFEKTDPKVFENKATTGTHFYKRTDEQKKKAQEAIEEALSHYSSASKMNAGGPNI